jgi:type VII secretion ATPase EccA
VNAREYLDTGIAALGLLNGQHPNVEQARLAFRRAADLDPAMCDAWMGLIAAGDTTVATLRHARQTSSTLHRETRRLGLGDSDLQPSVPVPGGYLVLCPTTSTGLALAYVAALISSGDYDAAEKELAAVDTGREPAQEPTLRFVTATLHFVTQRWPDVIEHAGQPSADAAGSLIDAANTLLAGIAHTGLGQFDTALSILKPLTPQNVPGGEGITTAAAVHRGLCHRALGDENAAREQFRAATIAGTLDSSAAAALDDPTYGPVVTTSDAIAARTNRWDPESGPTAAQLRREQDRTAAQDVLKEAHDELMGFVGLSRVKAHVTKLKNEQRYDHVMAQRGVDVDQDGSLHMLLVGPPGTAKTSIARIMCKMYYGLGILDSPEFIEVSREDLCGSHIGETEEKTKTILESARGRALFIDEAPTLYQPDLERDFGRRALDTIMKYAEDHRHDTLICLAGYATAMSAMLSANPGLRSRFPHKLEFDSSTPAELLEIADIFAGRYRVTIAEPGRQYFNEVAQWLCATAAMDGFHLIDIPGNGRYVRNVITEAARNMKTRVAEDPSIDLYAGDIESLRTITVDDMRTAITDVLNANDIHPPRHAGY